MKKFDHLTSLDAIDPLPCKLGAKVESGDVSLLASMNQVLADTWHENRQ